MPTDKTRAKIVDALLALAAERDFGSIGLGDVAKAADVSLGTLRESFDGRLAILAEFSRQIDRAMLAEGASTEATPRERLFEVIMRRFDALRPHRDALKGLARSSRRDPALAAALCRQGRRSTQWIMTAADIRSTGLVGSVALSGAALVYATAFGTFLDDKEPDLARTMAVLDRALERGDRWMRRLDCACSVLPRLAERGRARPGADAAG
jgi:AcrR family transcriptional regulator